jgi:UDP-N-acetylglucosamine 2-epimerase (non-hydrolysing)/GDP/UDP-N,N'-diacetylbacillosamine 2-epimerase (hydrolysing)
LETRGNGRIFVNLNAVVYWSLLASVDLMVGNSSSGIMETASLALPTVNVGLRQYGRERARNVLDARADKQSILDKIEEARCDGFKSSLEGVTNPYGDGHAAERIVEILTSVSLDADLLRKRSLNPE